MNMQLPLFNALNKFSTNSPIRSWLVYCACLFACFFIWRFEHIRGTEVFFHEIGEIAVASSVLGTVLFLVVRFLIRG